jgi:hypothetical protein
VPVKVKKMNDNLFSDIKNKITFAVNDMRMNDSEMTIKPGQFRRHPSKGSLGRETKEEKSERDDFLVFLERQKENKENRGELG